MRSTLIYGLKNSVLVCRVRVVTCVTWVSVSGKGCVECVCVCGGVLRGRYL